MKKYNFRTHSFIFFFYLSLGIFVSFDTFADIRESNISMSIPPTPTGSCIPNQTADEWLATLQEGHTSPDGTVRYSDYRITWSGVISTQPEYNFCRMRHVAERNRYLSDGNGGWYQPSNGGVNATQKQVSGTLEYVDACVNNQSESFMPPSEQHTIPYTDSSGQLQCFSPSDMAEIDTCEESHGDGNFETYISDIGGASCMPKEDGSVCPVSPSSVSEITTSSGETVYFYQSNLAGDNATCYGTSQALQNTTLNEFMPTDGCTTVGGLDYCSESSSNVCDGNGNCQAGCGSVTTGGQTSFVCAASDFDGDGVPDYQDPDLDGDGIPNDQDLDNDNDGVDDPVYQGGSNSNSSPFTTSSANQILSSLTGIKTNTENTSSGIKSLTGAVESLTGAIEGMTTGGGSGGFSEGAQQITDGIEELKEEITDGEFTAIGSRENGWSGLFGEEFLQELQDKKEALTTKFNEQYATIKAESSALISLTTTGATFQNRSLDLKGQTVDVSFARFSEHFSIIGMVLVFACTVFAMFIVIGGDK